MYLQQVMNECGFQKVIKLYNVLKLSEFKYLCLNKMNIAICLKWFIKWFIKSYSFQYENRIPNQSMTQIRQRYKCENCNFPLTRLIFMYLYLVSRVRPNYFKIHKLLGTNSSLCGSLTLSYS